ncbi:MAG: hypothetical protein AB7L71_15900 [Vicinamibacterales bacterium]|jgi:hypothetical protein
MYKEILRSIVGIEVFPIISLGLFVVSFAAVVFYAVRLDRQRAATFSELPLDPPSSSSTGDLK